jgi:hypothetical protein
MLLAFSCSQKKTNSNNATETVTSNTKAKKWDGGYTLLADMYNDKYYPKFLVDKVKDELMKVIGYLEQGNHSNEEIQQKFDEMTIAINDLQDEFYKNDSEIETAARESIGDAVSHILNYFNIGIDCETAIGERDW